MPHESHCLIYHWPSGGVEYNSMTIKCMIGLPELLDIVTFQHVTVLQPKVGTATGLYLHANFSTILQ